MRNIAIAFCLASGGSPAVGAENIFAQLNLSFKNQRSYTHRYDRTENALILEIQNTSPSELQGLDYYDERVIRRLLIKDLGMQGSTVKIVLRSYDVRASVYHLDEPFRILIDLFHENYQEEKDPTTGLPAIANSQSGQDPNAYPTDERTYNYDQPQSAYRLANEGSSSSAAITGQPTSGSQSQGKTHRLLQPVPKLFTDPAELNVALGKVEPGLGKAWDTFPIYVYRLQTAAYEAQENRGPRDAKPSSRVLQSSEAMAEYAGNLYNFGHESRALIAYQQVLQKEPSIFEKDALHLWKFAETHLGQGNITLARGYYAALIEKHPESPLAKFSMLRRLDLSSIQLLQTAKSAELPRLVPELDRIKADDQGELHAQIAIRRAYWSKTGKPENFANNRIPDIDKELASTVRNIYPNAESTKSAFLLANLIFAHLLQDAYPWNESLGNFASDYFKRFSGTATEPFRTELSDLLKVKLNKTIQNLVVNGKLIEAIRTFESLPNALQAIRKTPATAWALGEAYRKLGQGDLSVDFYKQSADKTTDPTDKFKSEFWLAVTAGNVAQRSKISGGAEAKKYSDIYRKADRDMSNSWNRLTEDQQRTIFTTLRTEFEETITNATLLRTPATILLSQWTSALSTNLPATPATEGSNWNESFSPTANSVFLISNLAKRFGELGMATERRKALALLRHMKPREFEDDKEAKKLWSDQLVDLAEEYRNANEFLEAGQLYKQIGEEGNQWEGRAESLYKAGLLLYRAGRRDQAMEAFQASAEDANNRQYSQLSKIRLEQLEDQ